MISGQSERVGSRGARRPRCRPGLQRSARFGRVGLPRTQRGRRHRDGPGPGHLLAAGPHDRAEQPPRRLHQPPPSGPFHRPDPVAALPLSRGVPTRPKASAWSRPRGSSGGWTQRTTSPVSRTPRSTSRPSLQARTLPDPSSWRRRRCLMPASPAPSASAPRTLPAATASCTAATVRTPTRFGRCCGPVTRCSPRRPSDAVPCRKGCRISMPRWPGVSRPAPPRERSSSPTCAWVATARDTVRSAEEQYEGPVTLVRPGDRFDIVTLPTLTAPRARDSVAILDQVRGCRPGRTLDAWEGHGV